MSNSDIPIACAFVVVVVVAIAVYICDTLKVFIIISIFSVVPKFTLYHQWQQQHQ